MFSAKYKKDWNGSAGLNVYLVEAGKGKQSDARIIHGWFGYPIGGRGSGCHDDNGSFREGTAADAGFE